MHNGLLYTVDAGSSHTPGSSSSSNQSTTQTGEGNGIHSSEAQELSE